MLDTAWSGYTLEQAPHGSGAAGVGSTCRVQGYLVHRTWLWVHLRYMGSTRDQMIQLCRLHVAYRPYLWQFWFKLIKIPSSLASYTKQLTSVAYAMWGELYWNHWLQRAVRLKQVDSLLSRYQGRYHSVSALQVPLSKIVYRWHEIMWQSQVCILYQFPAALMPIEALISVSLLKILNSTGPRKDCTVNTHLLTG